MSAKGFMLRMPPELHERLSAAAKVNDRSINAEINARLAVSFNEGVMARLSWLIQQVEALLGPNNFSTSILAEAIGHENPVLLNRVFSGLEEPSFSLLDSIAGYCCAEGSWLKHGKGQPFKVELQINYGAEFVSKLSAKDITAVHIVRCDSPEGRILVVAQHSEKDFTTFRTTINLSDIVGETGKRHQVIFQKTCEKLYRDGWNNIIGYIIKPDVFLGISDGKLHPLLELKSARRSLWVDDWWDREFIERSGVLDEYWVGFNKLINSIKNLSDVE